MADEVVAFGGAIRSTLPFKVIQAGFVPLIVKVKFPVKPILGCTKVFKSISLTVPGSNVTGVVNNGPSGTIGFNTATSTLATLSAGGVAESFIPKLIEVFMNNERSTEVIHSLASVTFVQEVDSATLSVIVPVLLMGFRSNLDSTKRLSAVIVANMIKLVVNPIEIEAYMPRLLPILQFASNNVSEPEARQMCKKSYESLNKLNDYIGTLQKLITYNDVYNSLELDDPVKSNISSLIYILMRTQITEKNIWAELISKYNIEYISYYEKVLNNSSNNKVEDDNDDVSRKHSIDDRRSEE